MEKPGLKLFIKVGNQRVTFVGNRNLHTIFTAKSSLVRFAGPRVLFVVVAGEGVQRQIDVLVGLRQPVLQRSSPRLRAHRRPT